MALVRILRIPILDGGHDCLMTWLENISSALGKQAVAFVFTDHLFFFLERYECASCSLDVAAAELNVGFFPSTMTDIFHLTSANV